MSEKLKAEDYAAILTVYGLLGVTKRECIENLRLAKSHLDWTYKDRDAAMKKCNEFINSQDDPILKLGLSRAINRVNTLIKDIFKLFLRFGIDKDVISKMQGRVAIYFILERWSYKRIIDKYQHLNVNLAKKYKQRVEERYRKHVGDILTENNISVDGIEWLKKIEDCPAQNPQN